MKYLIITVAGTATRFNKDTKEETLKCLYYTDSSKYTLLSQLISNCDEYDKYIIVGGYLFNRLEQFVKKEFSNLKEKIVLVYNEHFWDYGSGYSLFLGISAITKPGVVTFVEGDLFFDKTEFKKVYYSQNNVITINREPITSNKAVVLYLDENGKPNYLYDTSHKLISVPVPFTAIFNSGQIWKFVSSEKLLEVVNRLSKEQLQGTNLEIIQSYFNNLDKKDYDVVCLSKWFNCNTVADYMNVRCLME